MTNRFDGDVVVSGALVAGSMILPDSCVTSAKVQAGANLDGDKLEHRHVVRYSQPNTAATAETKAVYVARTTGIIREVVAGSIAAAVGDSTVTVDVKKNNTSVLSATIVLNNSNTARIIEAGAVAGAQDDLAAGDWLDVVVTVSAGTGTLPTGVFVQIEIDQNGV